MSSIIKSKENGIEFYTISMKVTGIVTRIVALYKFAKALNEIAKFHSMPLQNVSEYKITISVDANGIYTSYQTNYISDLVNYPNSF